jgi:hypothetical protein
MIGSPLASRSGFELTRNPEPEIRNDRTSRLVGAELRIFVAFNPHAQIDAL